MGGGGGWRVEGGWLAQLQPTARPGWWTAPQKALKTHTRQSCISREHTSTYTFLNLPTSLPPFPISLSLSLLPILSLPSSLPSLSLYSFPSHFYFPYLFPSLPPFLPYFFLHFSLLPILSFLTYFHLSLPFFLPCLPSLSLYTSPSRPPQNTFLSRPPPPPLPCSTSVNI